MGEDLDRILHDLRGPLNSVTMHLEILKRAVADDRDATASVAVIQAELARLAAMLPKAFGVLGCEPMERSADVPVRASTSSRCCAAEPAARATS